MELNIFDRLILLNVLPNQGDITTLRVIRDFQNQLSFSETEHKLLQFTSKDGKMNWKAGGDKNVEIEVGDKIHEIIVEVLTKLSKDEKLLIEHLPLYEKFITESD